MSTLHDFTDDDESRNIVAYAYQVARFSVFDDPDSPDRKITDWTWYVDREKPSEDDWQQEDVTRHRIQNVTPLVRGPNDVPEDAALGFEYEYKSELGDEDISSKLDTRDPRGSDAVIRCTPLVPVEYFETEN